MSSRVIEVPPLPAGLHLGVKEDEASFDPGPDGGQVLLTVNHRQITDRAMTLMTGAGSLRLKNGYFRRLTA